MDSGLLISSQDVCRTCLSKSDDMESIFENKMDIPLSIRDMLMSFCSIELTIADGFSEQICGECALQTLRAYNFKLKCEKSDELMRSRATNLEAYCKDESRPMNFSHQLKREQDDIKSEDDHSSMGICDIYIKKEGEADMDYAPTSDDGEPTSSDDMEEIKLIVKEERKKLSKKKKAIRNSRNCVSNADTVFRTIYECPKCRGLFKTFNMISKHLYKLHQVPILSLDQLNHFLRSQESTNFAAEPLKLEPDANGASDKLNSADELGGSCADEDEEHRYKCLTCEYKCAKFETVKAHIINKHRGERYIECDECNYKCTSMNLLVRHKQWHAGERRVACAQCPYRTVSNTQLRNHTAVAHSSERPYACHACPYSTKLKHTLLRHIQRKHEDRRDHPCPHCGKAFFAGKDLKMHLRTHTGEKPHVCEHCAMAFTQKSNLLKHVLVAHTAPHERPFACSVCTYRGRTVVDLRAHQRRHTGERPHQCDLCSARTSTRSALKLHMRRHAGERTYSCEQCAYSCYESESLKAHKRIHTGERPFACDMCGYRARTTSRLRNHKMSHSNTLKYSCQHCPYRANYRSNLIKHLEKNCGIGKRKYSRNPGSRYAASIKAQTQTEALTNDGEKQQHFSANKQL